MFKFERSVEKMVESKKYLAGGVASSLRASMKPTPLFVEKAEGSRVEDVDGNLYIDYLLAYGPLILGHAHPKLTGNIHQSMQKGYTYGLQHQGEIDLARRITELLPSADSVSLSGSGTEAVMLALRLARAHTGKRKVVRFHGHFHGWSDSIFTAFLTPDMTQDISQQDEVSISPGTGGQSEKSLEDVILLPWNDVEALESTLDEHGHEIAAVISEPVMCNNGCIIPKTGYLEKMRELTSKQGIVMILDEVITGFRFGPGGAQERLGVTPDLTTIGKAMGGGIAISGVAGRRELMQLVESGEVNHLGTLNGNPVSTAAALTVIEELVRNDGAAFLRMDDLTDELVQGIRACLKKYRIPGLINHLGPVFHMMFIEETEVRDFATFQKRDAAKYTEFAAILLEEGVLVRPSGLWYISAVHDRQDVLETLDTVERALRRLAAESTTKGAAT
ncbi:glutamate-1-semialdehyde 2,1-aminomutase [Virgibacillus subterraneus]|uniref:Glutamate-1-semialdehyde 2,1-aminomutase n=1 Tax=Virgibacillus subterraneus TaxID=621109 RepID=A0A1H9G6N7_9BACI|nr:aminotransferase class III-fold pyridoxal phosphate-dependent enzyme [Virgibacillus subterraneus]SEQ45680.1 glutamate-1-semialdehyde 2,1-aminomutase [Virgibacillus subterraneus]